MFTCLDHDDGSDYYLDTRNVCVFAGMKNYIGQPQPPHPLPSTAPKCGVSSFSRAARVRAARANDLAATMKTELTAFFLCFARQARTRSGTRT